jgi:hypothetical protein
MAQRVVVDGKVVDGKVVDGKVGATHRRPTIRSQP